MHYTVCTKKNLLNVVFVVEGRPEYTTLLWEMYLLKYSIQKSISNRNLRRSFISYRRNAGSLYLFRCYFDKRCSDRLQFFDPPVWTLTSRTLHSKCTPLNYTPSFSYYFRMRNLRLEKLYFQNCYIVERTPERMFPWLIRCWPYKHPMLHILIICIPYSPPLSTSLRNILHCLAVKYCIKRTVV